MKNFNVIYNDEDVIGKVKDIKECFSYELSKILTDEKIDIEEKINHIEIIGDLLSQLGEEFDNTIIKVSYNPMGCYYFNYLSWE
jgi:hypothetical protein